MDLNAKKIMLILFLGIWMLCILTFACISYLCRCIDCRRNGEIIVQRDGRRWRKKATIAGMITKRVKDHAFMNGRCERYLDKTMEYSNSVDDTCIKVPDINIKDIKDIDDETLKATEEQALDPSKIPFSIAQEDAHKKCLICLENFKVGELVSWSKNLAMCNHTFHSECLTLWLARKGECPCCRRQFYNQGDLDLKMYGCKGILRACLGFEQLKEHKALSIETQILHEYRRGADFCIDHGLILPPGYEVKATGDDEDDYIVSKKRKIVMK